jgi:hypothetical protein
MPIIHPKVLEAMQAASRMAKEKAPTLAKRIARAGETYDLARPEVHGGIEQLMAKAKKGETWPLFTAPDNYRAGESYAQNTYENVMGLKSIPEAQRESRVYTFVPRKDARVIDIASIPGSSEGRIQNPEKLIDAMRQLYGEEQTAAILAKAKNRMGYHPDDPNYELIGQDVWKFLEEGGGYDALKGRTDAIRIRDRDHEGIDHIAKRWLEPQMLRLGEAKFDKRKLGFPNWLAGVSAAPTLGVMASEDK